MVEIRTAAEQLAAEQQERAGDRGARRRARRRAGAEAWTSSPRPRPATARRLGRQRPATARRRRSVTLTAPRPGARGGEDYALPVDDVLEVAELGEVTPVPGAPAGDGRRAQPARPGAARWSTSRRSWLCPTAEAPERIVVTEHGGRKAGLAVDAVVGVEQLPEASEEVESPYLDAARHWSTAPSSACVDVGSVLDAVRAERRRVTEPDAEILEVFREEATERLRRMVETLLALESGRRAAPTPSTRSSATPTRSRAAPGWSACEEVRALAHTIEDALEEAREQRHLRAGADRPAAAGHRRAAARRGRRERTGERGAAGASAAISASRGTGAARRLSRRTARARRRSRPSAARSGCRPRRSIACSTPSARRSCTAAVSSTLLGERLASGREDEHLEERARARRASARRAPGLGDPDADAAAQLDHGPVPAGRPRPRRRTQDKEVELEISGAETQLDRVILDGISESIAHLLRNAVAHGIESPEERERAGKPPRGRVELRAEQRGGMVAIEVADDGRGVAPELVERGRRGRHRSPTSSPRRASRPPRRSPTSPAAASGSTRSRPTSSRSAAGSRSSSEPGRGTDVTMLLPLTLALLRVLVVERGGQSFGLPLTERRGGRSRSTTRCRSAGARRSRSAGARCRSPTSAQIVGAAAPELRERPQRR